MNDTTRELYRSDGRFAFDEQICQKEGNYKYILIGVFWEPKIDDCSDPSTFVKATEFKLVKYLDGAALEVTPDEGVPPRWLIPASTDAVCPSRGHACLKYYIPDSMGDADALSLKPSPALTIKNLTIVRLVAPADLDDVFPLYLASLFEPWVVILDPEQTDPFGKLDVGRHLNLPLEKAGLDVCNDQKLLPMQTARYFVSAGGLDPGVEIGNFGLSELPEPIYLHDGPFAELDVESAYLEEHLVCPSLAPGATQTVHLKPGFLEFTAEGNPDTSAYRYFWLHSEHALASADTALKWTLSRKIGAPVITYMVDASGSMLSRQLAVDSQLGFLKAWMRLAFTQGDVTPVLQAVVQQAFLRVAWLKDTVVNFSPSLLPLGAHVDMEAMYAALTGPLSDIVEQDDYGGNSPLKPLVRAGQEFVDSTQFNLSRAHNRNVFVLVTDGYENWPSDAGERLLGSAYSQELRRWIFGDDIQPPTGTRLYVLLHGPFSSPWSTFVNALAGGEDFPGEVDVLPIDIITLDDLHPLLTGISVT